MRFPRSCLTEVGLFPSPLTPSLLDEIFKASIFKYTRTMHPSIRLICISSLEFGRSELTLLIFIQYFPLLLSCINQTQSQPMCMCMYVIFYRVMQVLLRISMNLLMLLTMMWTISTIPSFSWRCATLLICLIQNCHLVMNPSYPRHR